MSQTVDIPPPASVDDSLIAQIVLYGNLRAPEEACGIVLPDRTVVELCNVSQERQTSFKMLGVDVVEALMEWAGDDAEYIKASEVMFWHTHPNDSLYPSTKDIESRLNLPDTPHLLVAVPSGRATLF